MSGTGNNNNRRPGVSRQGARYGNRNSGRKRIPVFGIVLTSCFVIIPLIFFIYGMQDAPGRERPANNVSPTAGSTPVRPVTDPPPTASPTVEPMPPAVKVRGIYYNTYASTQAAWEHCLTLFEETNLNAIVIDVKNDHGYFNFPTENEVLKHAYDSFVNVFGGTMITKEHIDDLKERGVYTIARIVCFKDNLYAGVNPSAAIPHRNGGSWRDSSTARWLNPFNDEAREYLAEACREAARIGFDEVQLDYVRFPTDGQVGNILLVEDTEDYSRYMAINDFVSYIRDELIEYRVRTSADVYGIAGISDTDARYLGQNMQVLIGSADSICPMIYPSHFANKAQNNVGTILNGVHFEAPDLEPYGVVLNSLAHYARHLERFENENPGVPMAAIRPYLQAFTAEWLHRDYWQLYYSEQIVEQINAVTDAGFEEWILWRSADNFYNPAAIP